MRELQKLRTHEIDCRWAKRGHRGRRAIRMDTAIREAGRLNFMKSE